MGQKKYWKRNKRGRYRAGKRAGKPNYSLDWRKYPYWMPDTPKGGPAENYRMVDIWHMKRVILYKLGYISIDGQRCDEHLTYTPDQIAHLHNLIEIADKKLKEGEEKYNKQFREGILSKIFEETESIVEQRKQCLNTQGDNEMAKKTFEEMMEWSKKQKDYDSQFNFLKFPQGIHCVRVLAGEDEDYFRSYTQHDCGSEKDFRSWLCWDYIMDNKDVREYYEEKELLTENDAKLAKKYGDPVCSTLEVIKKYIKDMEPIYKSLRTKTRCVMNAFYLYQAYPEKKTEKTPSTGLYVLEQSAPFNKLIISAMAKDSSVEGEDDALTLVSLEQGKMMAVQVEGEGIGKNRRTYTIDFKGKAGPLVYCEDGSNPFVKGAERLKLPEDFQIYNLQDVEALRFLSYQEVINQIKAIKTIRGIMNQIGYEIPGDTPSDNPLDDNYDEKFAKRTVGKPIKKELTEDSPIGKVEKKMKEKWEDEEVIQKEKKQVQSKKVVHVEDDDDDDDVPFEDEVELDAFEKAVPKSDPKKEVITNAPKKRKIF